MDAVQQPLHLPLRRVLAQDPPLGLGAGHDIGDPVVEAGQPRHATVRPLSRMRRLPSIFASGFRLASILFRLLVIVLERGPKWPTRSRKGHRAGWRVHEAISARSP